MSTEALRPASHRPLQASPNLPPTPASPLQPQEGFGRVLQRVGERIDRGEHLVTRLAAAPADLDAGQAIALQAGIYRYAETVDLVGKLVDRGCSAVKTTLQSGQ